MRASHETIFTVLFPMPSALSEVAHDEIISKVSIQQSGHGQDCAMSHHEKPF